jgi:glycosyltransferase involved in cell wall biosynthesis
MKIGMLTEMYKPVINGVTNSVALCKREMEAAGHQVTIFTLGHQDYVDDEPRVIRSPAIPLSDSGYHLGLVYSRQAREKLPEMDILHAHHPFISGRMAIRYGRQFNLPIVFTNHTRYDLYAQAYLPLLPPTLTAMASESYMAAFTTLCDLVVAPSEGLKQVALGWGVKGKVVVVPNGVDLDRLYSPSKQIPRAQLNIPDEASVLIYCGRLGPEKNLDFLLQAFKGAVSAVPEAFLLLIGGGSEEEALREKAAEIHRVRFAGPVDYDDVPAYLAIGDIFVTASVTEVHPLSVIEALAVGLPVLGIRSPGISDTVRDGVDGHLTDHELAAFTAMMVRTLLEPARWQSMAVQARERSKVYDARTTANTLLSHYEQLIIQVRARPPKAKLWETLTHKVQQVLGE